MPPIDPDMELAEAGRAAWACAEQAKASMPSASKKAGAQQRLADLRKKSIPDIIPTS
jgi:hypothetical protein